jgi:hypothetical protein
MAKLTPEAVKLLAHQLYDYSIPDDAAETVAHMVGAMASYARRLDALKLDGLQPPFGYPTMMQQADCIRSAMK